MCSGKGDRTCLLPGFPIRTSPDQSLVDSSPGLFAASHVLHRLLVPRHPPCALINLTTKMLASTVQFSSYGRSRHLLDAYPLAAGGSVGVTVQACPEGAGAAGPSGPNSVPRFRFHTPRSTPHRGAVVLAGGVGTSPN